jgi:hypothetical protein
VAPSLEAATFSIVDAMEPYQECVNTNPPGTPPNWIWSKPARQYFPQRSFMAITSTAYAEAYGLPMAQLQTGTDASGAPTFAAPTASAMAEALRHTEVDEASGTRRIDHAALPPTAYPATMPVYLAVPTTGLPRDAATDYANFLRRAVSTTYQTPGGEVGQLPAGYVPLPEELRQQARTVADALTSPVATTPPAAVGGGPTTPAGNGSGGASAPPPLGTPPGGAAPSVSAPAPTPSAALSPPLAQPRAATRADVSAWGAWALPAIFGIGLLVLLAVPLLLVAAQPDHPVRRYVTTASQVLRRRPGG